MNTRQLAAVAVIFSGAIAAAQPFAGILRDARHQPIAGAVVRLESSGHQQTATTASDGSFLFAALPPAAYSVAVEYQSITATLPQPVQLPRKPGLALELAAGNVLSLAEETQAPSGTGGEKLSAKAVSELPLNKRDFSQLLLLAAGTMTDTNGATNFTQQFAVNGQRGTAAVFAMDGAD